MDEYTNIETAMAIICDMCECLYPSLFCTEKPNLGNNLGKCDRRKHLEEDAADVAPVRHGRWAHLGGDEWCCSACGFVITTEGSWDKPIKKYCEDCGARMDEVK